MVSFSDQSVVVDGLSRAFSTLGHTVTVFSRLSDPSLPVCLTTADGVHVDSFDAAGPDAATGVVFSARLAAQWALDPPDVVHAYSWLSGKAAVAAARPLGIPVVLTCLGVARGKYRRDDEDVTLVREAARIIAMSSADVFALLGMGANPGAIKVIPCGVDLERFTPAARETGDARPLALATLGPLGAEAGVGDVIAALRYVPGVELRVGGGRVCGPAIVTDPEAQALVELARAHGVAERVSIVGRIEHSETPAFLRTADVFICTPRYDSIGTVALEAMACGVPAIVSAVGGLVDVVADGMTGIHVPPKEPRQLAYAIESLVADPRRRARFGRLGVERAVARYGWLRIAAETVEVYRSVAPRDAVITGTGP